MTLTRLIPTLRTSIPDPLHIDLWPEATSATTTDVIVGGISLLRLVEECGTPCAHSGAAVIPATLGRPCESHRAAVIVVRVVSTSTHSSGQVVIQTDAQLGSLQVVWSQLRLIGRASTAPAIAMLIAGAARDENRAESLDVFGAELPRDIRIGDLLAVPSRPMAANRSLQPFLTTEDAV